MDDSTEGDSAVTSSSTGGRGEASEPALRSDSPAGAGGTSGGAVTGEASDTATAHRKPPRTRVSATFEALIAGTVILVFLLIFILENTESVRINYLGAKGHLSLGVALLLSAVGGALIAAIVGLARIGQLRLHERRQRRR